MNDRRKIPEKPLKLDDLKPENIFSTPDGYFDRLPAQIQARIKKREDYGFRPVFFFDRSSIIRQFYWVWV